LFGKELALKAEFGRGGLARSLLSSYGVKRIGKISRKNHLRHPESPIRSRTSECAALTHSLLEAKGDRACSYALDGCGKGFLLWA
jgi:hypothetical protein